MGYLNTDEIPEEATHYMPETDCSHFSWIKFQGKDMFIICPSNSIEEWQLWQPILSEDEELVINEIPKPRYIRLTFKSQE